VILFELECSAE